MLKLNDVTIPSFVKVNKINYSILPPINNNTLSVRGRKGVYLYGQDVGIREISADVTIKATPSTIVSMGRILGEWMYHQEAVKLVNMDEPDRYFMVVPDGDTNIDELVSIGQGTIKFICVEPFAYGAEKTVSRTITSSNPFYFEVAGSAGVKSYPQIELSVKKDITDISVISNDEVVTIGEPRSAEQVPKNPLQLRLGDDMSNTSLWTTGTTTDGGRNYGSFFSDGSKFMVAGGDYGTGAGWTGASAIRSLPSPITDFEVQVKFTLDDDSKEEIGRIEVYLLDANNSHIGKVAMKEGRVAVSHKTFEARAGAGTNYNYFVNHPSTTAWHNFNGMMKIGRKGKMWYAWVGKYQPSTKTYNARLYKEWTDTKGSFTKALAKIQIHIGANGDYTPVKNMFIEDIKVYEHVELTGNQTPIIATTGDVLLIDNERSVIYKNGEPFYEALNPASKFISLSKGNNGIAVTPASANIKVTYKERWL